MFFLTSDVQCLFSHWPTQEKQMELSVVSVDPIYLTEFYGHIVQKKEIALSASPYQAFLKGFITRLNGRT